MRAPRRPHLRRIVVLSLVAFAALAGACTSYVDRAHHAYYDGRYLEVAEDLAAREAQVQVLEPRAQAQYGLYRGLSLMMLRDLAGAQQWLGFSADVDHRAPGALTVGERAQLDDALGALSRALGGGSGEFAGP